jgi:hypothetical protein
MPKKNDKSKHNAHKPYSYQNITFLIGHRSGSRPYFRSESAIGASIGFEAIFIKRKIWHASRLT